MLEKKPLGKNKPLPELRSSVVEILVTNGRAFQPFIRTFQYTGENVSKQNLGTLIGVFEIDDQSEDSAYIVNFLASVAKKEYFNNPRRGAIESFEAALHKINLALAELVKHGNVTWLGKFHGALGVLEKNNLHFSVSGQATILLLRKESIADISEGLASPESDVHPIKTFVEVSSGRLNKDDQILLSSPELLALFSMEELNKHASRMDSEHFTQFLKTALVNELDMAGLMIVDVVESITLKQETRTEKKASEHAPTRIRNVFSQSTFLNKKNTTATSVEATPPQETRQEKKEDYVDNKTGHIYVSGETPELPGGHPFLDALGQKFQEVPHHLSSLFSSLGKRLRKANRQATLFLVATGEEVQTLGRKTTRALRRELRRYQETREAAAQAKAEQKGLEVEAASAETKSETPTPEIVLSVSDIPRPIVSVTPPPQVTPPEMSRITMDTPADETDTDPSTLPSFMREKLAQFYRKHPQSEPAPEAKPLPKAPVSPNLLKEKARFLFDTVSRTAAHELEKCRLLFQQMKLRLRLLPAPKIPTQKLLTFVSQNITRLRTSPHRFLVLGALGVLGLGLVSWYVLSTPSSTPEMNTAEQEGPDENAEAPAKVTSAPGELTVALSDLSEAIVTTLILDDQVYVITPRTIITTDNTSVSLPSGEQAKFAAAMDDLRLIFLYTETGTLYAWSPITKTFVKNTLPFEGTMEVAGIDTYLTYLYVLDAATDQVYRFPRADTGFGTSTAWLRESIAIETTSLLAVNETLFIAPDKTTIKGFFRGRAGNTFEVPEGGISISALYTQPGMDNVYALDAEHKRIVIWNQDGRLIKEISHEKFADGTTLSVNEKQGQFFIGIPGSLLLYTLK